MAIRITGNKGVNIGGDLIKIEGNFAGQDIEIDSNLGYNIGGKLVNIVSSSRAEEAAKQLSLASQQEIEDAARTLSDMPEAEAEQEIRQLAVWKYLKSLKPGDIWAAIQIIKEFSGR